MSMLMVNEICFKYTVQLTDWEETWPKCQLSFAGMVMQLKKSVGEKFILDRERNLAGKAKQKLSKVDNLVVLGNAFCDGDI